MEMLCNKKKISIQILQPTDNEQPIPVRHILKNPVIINTLRPRQNGSHFPVDVFKAIFVYEDCYILIKMSLKYVPQGPIDNIPALVQIMAWCRSGDKSLSEPMMAKFPDAYMRHSPSMLVILLGVHLMTTMPIPQEPVENMGKTISQILCEQAIYLNP